MTLKTCLAQRREAAKSKGPVMPIHDWSKVDAGLYHSFCLSWVVALSRKLNSNLLPTEYYSLNERTFSANELDELTFHSDSQRYVTLQNGIAIFRANDHEPVARLLFVEPANKSTNQLFELFLNKVTGELEAGIHLLIVDLFKPTRRDPQGIHGAVWKELSDIPYEQPSDKPLTLVAYEAGMTRTAYIEPIGLGDVLPDMPVFLEPGGHVLVPLESTYQEAWDSVPLRWRREIE